LQRYRFRGHHKRNQLSTVPTTKPSQPHTPPAPRDHHQGNCFLGNRRWYAENANLVDDAEIIFVNIVSKKLQPICCANLFQ
jgi:hypothetical protein